MGKKIKRSGWFWRINPWNPFVIAGFLIILLAGAGLIGNHIRKVSEARAEKNDLIAKHEQLEQIANQIAAKNPPDERESSRTCRYQSRKFEKGDLFCTVNTSLIYQSINSVQANSIRSSSSTIVGSLPVNNVSKKESIIFPSISDPLIDELSQQIEFGDKCFATYKFPVNGQNKNTLRINLFCSEQSISEHFTLEK